MRRGTGARGVFLVPASPSHQRQHPLWPLRKAEVTMATRHRSQEWNGARPMERPVGQAGLQGHCVCVSGTGGNEGVSQRPGGEMAVGKGGSVRHRFRALS